MTDAERVAGLVRSLDDFVFVEDLALPYNHMGATITDAVLQAGLRYETTVWPRVQHVMAIPEAATTSGFLATLRERGGEEVVRWTHAEKLGRMEAVAELFIAEGVETEADLRWWLCGDVASGGAGKHETSAVEDATVEDACCANAAKLAAIRGMGPKTIDYFKILCGAPDATAVDVHLTRFLERAGVTVRGYEHAREVVAEAAGLLGVSTARLDHSIWTYMSREAAADGQTRRRGGQMAAVELGRLTRVELREAWRDEATDFTPWLAQEENLELLGETLGISLELEATERSVGPFAADILCKDPISEQWVLIENQLEQTDHGHLGQIITYAAGLNAVTVIWIARKFVEQHRAALDWLNEITAEGTNFFGVEVELWRIGDAPHVAPKFNIVSKPNAWSKQVPKVARESREWGEETFFAALEKDYPAAVAPASAIYAWAKEHMPEVWWGKGAVDGSLFPGITVGSRWYSIVSLWTYGKLEFQFERMRYRPVFDDQEKRLDLLHKLNNEVGLALPESRVDMRPSVPLATFTDGDKLRALLSVFEWYVDELKRLG